MLRTVALLLLLLLLFAAPPATAARTDESSSLRIAIVLDNSGSMKATDPGRLSITAAMIATQLAGADDQVSLVPLSGKANPLQRGGGAAALARLRAFTRRSPRTIYEQPLRQALARLSGSRAGRPIVLFLTDGEPDPGTSSPVARDQFLQQTERYLRRLSTSPPRARIYPVLLGSLGQRWRGLFDDLARATGARNFQVAQSGDALIEVFATIYAEQLGSRVIVSDLTDGRHELATMDDFVRYANLVVISRQGPFSARYPAQRRSIQVVDNGSDPKSQRPPVYHLVDKLRPAGHQKLQIVLSSRDKGSPAGSYRALLIWDYDLLLHLAPPVRQPDGSYRLRARLTRRSPPHSPITKRDFLQGVTIAARVCDPRGNACKEPLQLRLGSGGAFTGAYRPDAPGALLLDAVCRRQRGKNTVLELPSVERYPLDIDASGQLSCGKETLRFELDQNADEPWSSCAEATITLRDAAAPVRVRLDSSALALPKGVTLRFAASEKQQLLLQPGVKKRVEVCLHATALVDRPGFTALKDKALAVVASDADKRWLAAGARSASLPIAVDITARSWWNRYRRLIIALGIALLLLLLLIWIVRGFLSPHSFAEGLKVNWGKSLERLERNEMPVSEIPRAQRGFYRNAQLWIGGGHCFVESGWPAYARFEATAGRGICLQIEEGTEVQRVNKFETDKRDPVSSGALVSLGDVYLVNDLFVRLKL